MSQFFRIHPVNPQHRLIHQAVEILKKGGVIVYPTDSAYALGCHIGDKKAIDRIRDIRRLKRDHHFALVCRDLSDLGIYAKVHNSAYRQIKAVTPGPYTFILSGNNDLPPVFKKRKEVGIRIPDHHIPISIVTALGHPIVTASIKDPDQVIEYTTDPELIREYWDKHVDLIIDGGIGGNQPSTIIDVTQNPPVVLREGLGSLDVL